SRRRHTRFSRDWSSDVCSSDLVEVNLNGMFWCARAAFRQMRHQVPQGGRIINNGSISSITPRPGATPYNATKHGVLGLTKSLARSEERRVGTEGSGGGVGGPEG